LLNDSLNHRNLNREAGRRRNFDATRRCSTPSIEQLGRPPSRLLRSPHLLMAALEHLLKPPDLPLEGPQRGPPAGGEGRGVVVRNFQFPKHFFTQHSLILCLILISNSTHDIVGAPGRGVAVLLRLEVVVQGP